MPRKRRISKQRLDRELKRLLTNPFAALDEPWENPDFPWAEAKRMWVQIREEALEQWAKQYPGNRPWAYWRFEQRMAAPPREEQRTWLQRHGLLTPSEKRVLALYKRD